MASVQITDNWNVFARGESIELPALDMPPAAKTAHNLCQELTYAANTDGIDQECHEQAAYEALRSLADQMGYTIKAHVDAGELDRSIGKSGYAWMRERGD